jgi:hypothetical protein
MYCICNEQPKQRENIMASWVEIADDNIRMLWKCQEEDCCGGEDCTVNPTFYQENGTPICSVGNDMDYIKTEIDTGSLLR